MSDGSKPLNEDLEELQARYGFTDAEMQEALDLMSEALSSEHPPSTMPTVQEMIDAGGIEMKEDPDDEA